MEGTADERTIKEGHDDDKHSSGHEIEGMTMTAPAIAGHNKHGTTSTASIVSLFTCLRNHFAKKKEKKDNEDKFYYYARVARSARACLKPTQAED
jgi:hypothetical protein